MGWFKLGIRKWETFNGLSAQQRSLFLEAFFFLIFVAIALSLSDLKTTQKLLLKLPRKSVTLSDLEREKRVTDTATMVKVAARYCHTFTHCLQKSLVLWQLLHWQGIESELKIGVRRDRGQFEAHAWVEYQGIPLNEVRDTGQDFTPFDRPISG